MDAGEYVPDEVTNLMVRNRIDEADAAGLPARRLPAHPGAGRELDGMIGFTGHRLDAVSCSTVDARSSSSGCCSAPRPTAAPTTPRT